MGINMEGEFSYFLTGIDMKAIMQMESQKEMVCIIGRTGRFTKANSRMESGTVMANGSLEMKNMKEIM